MAATIDIAVLRNQCSLGSDTSQDSLLVVYAAAAVKWIERQTALTFDDGVPDDLLLVVLLLVGEFFENRSAGAMSAEAEARARSICMAAREPME